MNKVKRLGIDLDGVLANFSESFLNIVNTLQPERLPADYLPKEWNWPELSKQEFNEAWEAFKATPNVWERLSAYKNNVEALQTAIELRFVDLNTGRSTEDLEVYYITSRVPSVGRSLLFQCNAWLAGEGLSYGNTSIVIVNPAEKAEEAKVAIARALGLHAIIDDKLETVIECSKKVKVDKHGTLLRAYLLNQPWNQQGRIETSSTFIPVDDVKTFLEREGLLDTD